MRFTLITAVTCLIFSFQSIHFATSGENGPTDTVQPPEHAPGWPSRDQEPDLLSGFQDPPPGYGQVPFYWWSGEDLDTDRLIRQIRKLHNKSVSGVQINYSHHAYGGRFNWPTADKKPSIFTEKWWEVFSDVAAVCSQLNMGIGMSTYTLDWPGGASNLFHTLFYSNPDLNAIELRKGSSHRVTSGQTLTISCPADQIAAHAYPVEDGTIKPGGIDLTPFIEESSSDNEKSKLEWTAPEGDGKWEVRTFRTHRKPDTLNALMDGMGERVVRDYFQQFVDHNNGSARGLNFFFNDELHLEAGKLAWTSDFAQEFKARKGYNLFDYLPAMWKDIGPVTPKVRMDYADVRMSLIEERYFRPIYNWHASHGIIFGSDNLGRGKNPEAYGDYFRANRWYTAPGHDTPGDQGSLIKGKVSSSIANLYQRPRVQLEGYHSIGWDATPADLMFATRENYLYGCNLLSLHGLYYSTYGSYWEWAPPSFHFRMPYWRHMDVFFNYFQRLSYLLSQGKFVSDVAVVYPVAPYEADMNGPAATDTAFQMARKLMASGINFEFIDHGSLARAKVKNGRLKVPSAGTSYRALVFPGMKAVRWSSIKKAAAFSEAGGTVYNIGALPVASDRAGRDDPELTAKVEQAFKPDRRFTESAKAVNAIQNAFVQDVRGIDQTVRALHRKIGKRDVYMVMDADPGSVVEFRSKGAVELWNPWTGETRPLRVTKETPTGLQVRLPLERYEAQIVVFTPGEPHENPPRRKTEVEDKIQLPHQWNVEFVPTMDNRDGDFRLPVTPENKTIGLEARTFAWARETPALADSAMDPDTDDSDWSNQLYGHGPQFYVLGPIPKGIDAGALDQKLAGRKTIDPEEPVSINGETFSWHTYEFSWRRGKGHLVEEENRLVMNGDPGPQGFHGLKGNVTDDFLCLGKQVKEPAEYRYKAEEGGQRYYLWTSATVSDPVQAEVVVSRDSTSDKSQPSSVLTPAAIYVNGETVDARQPVALNRGANPVLIRYDQAGRGHFVLRRKGVEKPDTRTPLSMRWFDDPGVIPFDVHAGQEKAEWFRFVSAPGTSEIQLDARGEIRGAWIDGTPMRNLGDGHFAAPETPSEAAVVALRIDPDTGRSGGEVIPKPVKVKTDGSGTMPLGDWSKMGILNNYSGGVSYSTDFSLTEKEAEGRITLDLERVVATAGIYLNGKKVAELVAPPWEVDVSDYVKTGVNKLDITVFNTLSNHYQTIPSRYKGTPHSGLYGPVRLIIRQK